MKLFKNLIIAGLLLSSAVVVTSCGNDEEENNPVVEPQTNEFNVVIDNVIYKVKEGEKLAEPTKPTKPGYTFVGYVDSEGNVFSFDTVITKSYNLTSKFEKIEEKPVVTKYVVTFDVEGTTTTQEVVANQTATMPTEPTKEGYVFTGWYLDGALYAFETPVIKDITLVAQFVVDEETLTKYVVTFDVEGTTTTQEVTENTSATKPEDPTKDGYAFAGWYLNDTLYSFDTVVTSNITLTAKFNKLAVTQYKVTFNRGITLINSVNVEESKTVTKPADPAQEGHTFVGWYSDNEFTNLYDFATPVTGNLNLYAKFDVNQYTVKFMDADVELSSSVVDYNTILTAPEAPVKEGYTFIGWYSGTVKYDFTQAVKNDLTLTALYEETIVKTPIEAGNDLDTSTNNGQTVDMDDLFGNN